MMIEVKLFAAARQIAGADSICLEVAATPTVGAVRQALIARLPAISGLAARALFAVNAEYARDEALIPDNAEVACIPPVSGG